ncbi:MAG: hypothetical protein ACI9JN_001838 [Bacteroidia bacterium]
MSSDSSKKNTKFLIDGDIQTPKESSYLQEVDKVQASRFKRLSISLLILLIAAVAFCIIQYFHLQKRSEKLSAVMAQQNETPLQETITQLSNSNDSLSIALARLKLANDVLTENLDPSKGMFFEVHMNFSGDFDLVQYKTELASLISAEYDGREKLVLGRFRSFKKALLFENDLKKMGLKDLYLLGRVDGKIMTFKEALALAQKQNK